MRRHHRHQSGKTSDPARGTVRLPLAQPGRRRGLQTARESMFSEYALLSLAGRWLWSIVPMIEITIRALSSGYKARYQSGKRLVPIHLALRTPHARRKTARNLASMCPRMVLISEFRVSPHSSASGGLHDSARPRYAPPDAHPRQSGGPAGRPRVVVALQGRTSEDPVHLLGKPLCFSPDDPTSIARSGTRPARFPRPQIRRGRSFSD